MIESYSDPETFIMEKYLYSVIIYCLKTNRIQYTDNIESIMKTVYSDEIWPSVFDKLGLCIDYTESLEKSINLELEHEQYYAAIILAMTCVEHLLNEFYKEYLEEEYEMSNAQIESLLKSNSTSEKISGLFVVTFNREFSAPIKGEILDLNKKRNGFIHYKMKYMSWDEVDNDKSDVEIKKIALDSPLLITKLRAYLEEINKELYPIRNQAKDIFDKIKSKKEENPNGKNENGNA